MDKINVGCGKRDFGDGWYNVDGSNDAHIDSHDIYLSQIPGNSANIVYASHIISYFNRTEVIELLKSWHRVLNPCSGQLMLAVPDFGAIAKLYQEKEYEIEQFLGLLYGEMEMNGEKIYHKTVYDHKSLSRLLESAGFTNIERVNSICPYGKDDHSCAVLPHMNFTTGTPMSLNITAQK